MPDIFADASHRCLRGTTIRLQQHYEEFLNKIIADYNKANIEARPELLKCIGHMGLKLASLVEKHSK